MSQDKKTLLFVADGPESIEIYTSENEAVVDHSPLIPVVYLIASTHGAYVKLGPFCLESIRKGIEAIFAEKKQEGWREGFVAASKMAMDIYNG